MESENNLKGKKVETYADDMAKAISGSQGGLIKKIIHEEEEKEALKKNISPETKKNKLFLVLSITLFILAVSIFGYLFITKKNKETISIAPQFTPLIFTDKTDFQAIDGLSKEKIADSVFTKVKNTRVKTGGIEGIYFTENKKVVGFKKFSSIIKNDVLTENIKLFQDNFLFGVVNKTSTFASDNTYSLNKYPFMLLKVKSFTDIFPVMRGFESKMMYGLHGFFGINISPTTNYLFTKSFEDGIIQNKNARILRNNEGQIIIMYVFLDDSSLVITNSEVATGEIIDRVFASKVKK